MATPEPALTVIWNYSASPLVMPAGTLTGEALAISDSGHVVGWVEDPATYIKLPVRWDATGLPTLLNTSGATYGGAAHDVNDQGIAVGALFGYGSPSLGVMWQGTKTLKLHALPGDTESIALGINERGLIVGSSSGPAGRRAVTWSGPGASTDIHPGSPWTESQAEDVNERGDITGWVRNAWGTTHAFLWRRRGTNVDLGATFSRSVIGNQGFGINNAVDVAGVFTLRFGSQPAVWYGSGLGTGFPIYSGGANAISDRARVVGSYMNGFEVAFTGTSTTTWEDLPGAPPNYSNQAVAYDVNTCGTVVGWLQRFNVGHRPVKWVKADCDRG